MRKNCWHGINYTTMNRKHKSNGAAEIIKIFINLQFINLAKIVLLQNASKINRNRKSLLPWNKLHYFDFTIAVNINI